MSTLSLLWQKHRHRWYRRGIDKEHGLRRHLAYYVARHGFEIGDYSYGAPIIRQWGGCSRLVVGRYCSIGDGVEFVLGGNHRVERVTTYPMSMLYGRLAAADHTWSRGDIIVGSDVWIGLGAVVLSGLKIGHGAVVGAHTLVTRDVDPYCVVVGNPAKPLRQRFSGAIIAQMLDLRWWDLDKDQLRALLPLMQSDQIETFIQECRKIRTGISTTPAD
jgi:acetyltransferase-like isoleucine patch superfamily enzyme